MNSFKKQMMRHFERFAGSESSGLRAVFCIMVSESCQSSVAVYVEKEDANMLVESINEQLTRMLGSPHHVVSTEKLQRFCALHGLSGKKLLEFAEMERRSEMIQKLIAEPSPLAEVVDLKSRRKQKKQQKP